jgi:hypothetical protein
MLLARVKRVIAVGVVAIGVLQMAAFSSPASAEWRHNSDQLPGMEDSSDAIAGGAVVALAVAAVVGIVYAIVKWNKKPQADAEMSQVPRNDNIGSTALKDLKSDPNPTRSGLKDRVLMTGLSVNF